MTRKNPLANAEALLQAIHDERSFSIGCNGGAAECVLAATSHADAFLPHHFASHLNGCNRLGTRQGIEQDHFPSSDRRGSRTLRLRYKMLKPKDSVHSLCIVNSIRAQSHHQLAKFDYVANPTVQASNRSDSYFYDQRCIISSPKTIVFDVRYWESTPSRPIPQVAAPSQPAFRSAKVP